jgi:hypothetical protein
VKFNLARGLYRIGVIGAILWIAYSLYHYDNNWCIIYDIVVFYMTFIEPVIGVPVFSFVLIFGTMILWVGLWVANGFRSDK